MIQTSKSDTRSELFSAIAFLGELRVERVELPETTTSFQIARPVDVDHLIDRAAADPEQNLPYWAELWPSGIALAAAISQQPGVFRGTRVLELGCGLGVTAIAALRAGAKLLVTDYAQEALDLCALNCLDQAGSIPASRRMNWRAPDQEFFDRCGNGFPVVLAADVLYERRDVEPLLALAPRVVAPGGTLWLAEPGRPPAARFLTSVREQGWTTVSWTCGGPWPDPEDNRKGVAVGVHGLRRPES